MLPPRVWALALGGECSPMCMITRKRLGRRSSQRRGDSPR